MRRKFYKFVCILAVSVFSLNCFSIFENKSPDSVKKSKLSAQVFETTGFQVKKYSENLPDGWQKEQFQTIYLRNYEVKSLTSLEEQQNTFPRYKIVEEIYETEDLADKRLKRIQEKPPNLPVEQEYYWIVTGFRHQKNVYFIQTDASVFKDCMEDFSGKLAVVIK